MVHQELAGVTSNCHTEINGTCVECDPGYTLTPNGTCIQTCPTLFNCASCDDSTGVERCDTCINGYYPLPFGQGCSPEPFCAVPDCQTCDPNTFQCHTCKGGYTLAKDGTCTRKMPFWFWIVVGVTGAVFVTIVLYVALHHKNSQVARNEWVAEQQAKFSG